MAIFDEQYRVVAVEPHRLTVQGVSSGDVLVINAGPDMPIAEADFPVGRLIALSDPSASLPN
jgi:hypothetical protein